MQSHVVVSLRLRSLEGMVRWVLVIYGTGIFLNYKSFKYYKMFWNHFYGASIKLVLWPYPQREYFTRLSLCKPQINIKLGTQTRCYHLHEASQFPIHHLQLGALVEFLAPIIQVKAPQHPYLQFIHNESAQTTTIRKRMQLSTYNYYNRTYTTLTTSLVQR